MRRISLEDFSGLVGAIYKASVDSNAWDAFASLLAANLGGVRVAFHAHNFQTNISLGFIAAHWDPEYVASYRREYASLNPWATAAIRHGVGHAQTSEALVDPGELRRTRFYNEWVKPQEDIGTGAGVTVFRGETAFVRISTNIRRRDQEKLQSELMRVLNLLSPHLQRALTVTRHLGGHRLTAELESVLDHVGGAVLLVDAKGRQHHANRRARDLRDLGVYDLDRSGRVVMHDPEADADLARAVHHVASGDPAVQGKTFKVRAVDGRRRAATIAPLVQSGEVAARIFDEFQGSRPVAILCIADDAPTAQNIKGEFGLTPAESALALSLFEGGTLQSFAEKRHIRVGTARKQLKAIFDKTGTAKQSQLVSLIARSRH